MATRLPVTSPVCVLLRCTFIQFFGLLNISPSNSNPEDSRGRSSLISRGPEFVFRTLAFYMKVTFAKVAASRPSNSEMSIQRDYAAPAPETGS